MKINRLLFLSTILLFVGVAECKKKSDSAVSFSVQGTKGEYTKLKTLFFCHSENKILLRLSTVICEDLNFTDQFDVEIKKTNSVISKSVLAKLFKDGTSLSISLKGLSDSCSKVYLEIADTSSGFIVFSNEFDLAKNIVVQGHEIAEEILFKLTGEKGVCTSSLAYCKMQALRHKIICVSDYSCNKSMVVVPTKRVNIAPSWHTQKPLLFYSQLTKVNNRLMSIDLRNNQKKVVCSYNGLNMQPSFSEDGSKVVLCLSGGRGNSELYLYDNAICKQMKRRVFKQLTGNGANNVSPCLLPNGDILFCSDYNSGYPQIYYLNNKNKTMRRLTGGHGYCAAPSYCLKTNKVIYTRPVNGTFQLFVLSLDDINSVKEQQITFGSGNKHEPSWSACGQYAVFSLDVEQKGRLIPQIAVLNFRSGKIRVLTHSKEPKSFPRWGRHLFASLTR
jgi:tol-pal system beta propeller repeat protein TolB